MAVNLLGVDVGERWQALAHSWVDPVGHGGYYAFNDVHALLALLGSGDAARAQALLERCRAQLDAGPSTTARWRAKSACR